MPKIESFYSPVGTVKFPQTIIGKAKVNFLHVPENIPEEEKSSWKFQLILDPKEDKVKEIMALLDEQAKPIKGANFKPYKADKVKKDPDDKECKEYVDSGLIAINFTSGYPVTFIDSMKKEIDNVKVGWGSKVRVKFNVKPVNSQGKVGLGRYVRAIQILELAEVGQDFSGFDEDDSGYKSPEAAKTAEAAEWTE